ncbi:hypothetical protein BT69DRAFT_1328490 [Atractiella rhizophila]|nr:hypothetical protein BT69DRAFT_1328490 [Atractiella rhizophila]
MVPATSIHGPEARLALWSPLLLKTATFCLRTHLASTFYIYVPGGASEQMAPTYPSLMCHHPSSEKYPPAYPPAVIQYTPASSSSSSSTQYSEPPWDSDPDIRPYLFADPAEHKQKKAEYMVILKTLKINPVIRQQETISNWQAGGYTYQ